MTDHCSILRLCTIVCNYGDKAHSQNGDDLSRRPTTHQHRVTHYRFLILLLVVVQIGLSSTRSNAQTYTVTFQKNVITGSCQYLAGASCFTASYDTDLQGKPTKLFLAVYRWDDKIDGQILQGFNCEQYDTIDLPATPCGSISIPLEECGASGSATISWKPNASLTDNAKGNLCPETILTFTGAPGFDSYAWYYKKGNGAWINLPNEGSDRISNKTAEEIFGTAYTSILNSAVYLHYRVGNCELQDGSNIVGPFNFLSAGPEIKEISVEPPKCVGSQDASATITHSVEPGASYQYTLFDGEKLFTLDKTPPEIAVFNGLTAGHYSLQVEKNSGCFSTALFDVIDPPLMTVDLLSTKNPTCLGGNNGSVSFYINDGTEHFKWKIYSGSDIIKESPDETSSRDITVENLSAGNYNLVVTDMFCSKDAGVPFTISDGPPIEISISGKDPTCLTDTDLNNIAEGNGTITCEVTSLPDHIYNYYLYEDDDDEYSALGPAKGDTFTFESLANKSYTVKVITNNLCYDISPGVTLTGPSKLLATTLLTDPTCINSSDGKMILDNVTKATGEIRYSYQLTDAATDLQIKSSALVTDVKDFVVDNNLSAGLYNLSIVDLCSFPQTTIELIDLKLSKLPAIKISPIDDIKLSCFEDVASASFSVQSGLSPITVDVVKEGSSITGYPKVFNSPPQLVLTELQKGIYSVNVTENCSVPGVVDDNINEGFGVTATSTSPLTAEIRMLKYDNNSDSIIDEKDFHLTCANSSDGRIEVEVSGGVPGNIIPYQIELLDSELASILTIPIITTMTKA
jgi:hypothetical protein